MYSLLSTYLFAVVGTSLSSCNEPNTSANTTQSQKKQIKTVYVYKKPELKLRIDTLNVSDDDFKKIATQGAAGVFFSAIGRARVAAINEIMAPASEIIEVDIISIQ